MYYFLAGIALKIHYRIAKKRMQRMYISKKMLWISQGIFQEIQPNRIMCDQGSSGRGND